MSQVSLRSQVSRTFVESLESRTLLSYAQPLFPAGTMDNTDPTAPIAFNGSFWFKTISSDYAVYRSDGTAAGTVSTKATLPQIQAASFGGNSPPVVMGNKMFLIVGQSDLWVTDGTSSGTLSLAAAAGRVANGPGSTVGSVWGQIANGKLYFLSYDSNDKAELFQTDGTVAGTKSLTASIASQGSIGQISGIVGTSIYFTLVTSSGASRLMRTDATTINTIATLNTGVDSAMAFNLQSLNATQDIFSIATNQGARLYVTDNTAAGTKPIQTTLTYLAGLKVFNDVAYFLGTDGTGGNATVYRTDGTAAGTYKVTDTSISTAYVGVTAYTGFFAGRLYFQPSGYNQISPTVVISSDGTFQTANLGVGQTIDGDKWWLSTGSYVTTEAPLTVVHTDANDIGSAAAEMNGKFLYTIGSESETPGPIVYVWDSNSPKSGSVSGTVWNDADGDGIHESNEPAVGAGNSVTLDLMALGDPQNPTAIAYTDANGNFTFPFIPAGTWKVSVDARSGVIAPIGSTSVTVAAGAATTGVSVLAAYHTTLIGYVYNDLNNNGVRDSGEPGIAGVQVYVDGSGAPTPQAGEPVSVTDANGRYEILNANNYANEEVRYVAPTGYRASSASYGYVHYSGDAVGVVAGTNFGLTNTPLPGGATFNFAIDINADGAINGADAAAAQSSIRLYDDANGNGIFDASEQGAFLNTGGGALTNLAVGTHTFRLDLPAGWTSSLAGNAVQFNVQSNQTLAIPQFTITASQPAMASLSGRLFNDLDFSRAYSSGDAPVPGVLVFVDPVAGYFASLHDPYTYTDGNGSYSFAGLGSGVQNVDYVPNFYIPLGGVLPYSFTATTGASPVTHDVPLYQTARYSGQVRLDANHNGVLDASDPVVANAHLRVPFPDSESSVEALSDANGNVSFLGMAGTYAPVLVGMPGYTLISAATATLKYGETSDNNVVLISGSATPLYTVSGNVFLDANYNGVRDAGDTPIKNYSAYADLNGDGAYTAGEPYGSSDANGNYTIGGLAAGTYTVRLYTPPTQYQIDSPTSGSYSLSVGGLTVTGKDFAVGRASGVVNGIVFHDYNGNGIQDAGDDPIDGLQLYVDTNNNGVYDANEPTTTTSDGQYAFYYLSSLQTAAIRVRTPSAWSLTQPVTLTTSPLRQANTINFGATNNTGQIVGGLFYGDDNQNGAHDSGEYVGSGYGVQLINPATQAVIATTLTNSAGFRFTDVAPGTYRVTATLPNVTFIEGNGGYSITVAANQIKTVGGFGYHATNPTYTGRIYLDVNRNGQYDSADTGMAGVRTFLDANFDGLYESGEVTALTNAAGIFTFANVAAIPDAGYPQSVYVQTPLGYVRTSYGTQPLHVTFSSNQPTADAGTLGFNLPTGTYVSGYLYNDANLNGQRDPGEAGIPFQQVGSNFAQGTSDAVASDDNGFYVYYASAGTKKLAAQLPSNWIGTDPIYGGSKTVTLVTGQGVSGVNFGWVPFQLAGTLFNDANNDGAQDNGESVIASRVVYIDSNSDGSLDNGEQSTTSDANGSYSFASLGAGTFKIAQVLPTGWTANAVAVTLAAGVAKGGVALASRLAAADPATVTLEAEAATLSGAAAIATKHAGFTGSGYVGGSTAGSAVQWSIQRAAATTATLTFRYSNGDSAARPFSVIVNGIVVGTVAGAPNGSWDKWSTATLDVALAAGANTIKIGSVGLAVNLDNVSIAAKSIVTPPTTDPVSVTLEAEAAALSGGAVTATKHPGFTGSGYVSSSYNGAALQWAISRAAAGTVTLTFRYANGDSVNRPFSVIINGVAVGTVAGVKTGSYDTWATASIDVTLAQGQNTIQVVSGAALGVNFDNLTIATKSGVPPTDPMTASLSGTSFDDSNKNGALDTTETRTSGKTVFLDTNNNGKLDAGEKSVVSVTNGVFSFANLAAGTYHVRRVFPNGYTYSTTLIDLTLSAGQTVAGLVIGSKPN